jgi:hypothetical protein
MLKCSNSTIRDSIMTKIKLNKGKIIKKHEGDTFIFINGVTTVPGFFFHKKRTQITLQECIELTSAQDIFFEKSCKEGLIPLKGW